MIHAQTHQRASTARHWSLDLMRIIATMGIILLHTSPLPVEYHNADGLPWRAAISLSILFRWCAPAFFMISGALFLAPERQLSVSRLYRKTILRIVTSFTFWSAFYAIVHCLLMNKGKWTFLNQFFRGHYHMWYIFSILALYMLTPFIRKMTESKKLTEYFLGLGLLFTYLLPRMISFIQLFELPHADVFASIRSIVAQANPLSGIYPLYYFVLGHYLHTYPPRKALRIPMIAIGAMGLVLTLLLTLWHSSLIGGPSGQFYDISSTTVLAMSAGIFLLFESMFSDYHPGRRMRCILLTLSECSFGVYLVHPFFIERIEPTLPPEPIVLIIGTLAISLGIYLLSFLCSFLLHKIPVLNRYIV